MPFIRTLRDSTNRVFTRVQVRALLAFLFAISLTVGFFLNKIDPESYEKIAWVAIVWYFTKRQVEGENGNDTQV